MRPTRRASTGSEQRSSNAELHSTAPLPSALRLPCVKDMLGATVEIGDIILSAGTATGRSKIGQVYGFDKNDNPMIRHQDKKYNFDTKKYEDCWRRSAAGFHALILMKWDTNTVTQELHEKVALIRETDLG